MWLKHAKNHQLYCIFTFSYIFYEWSIFNEYKTIVYFINFCIFLFPKFLFKISDDLHDYIQWPHTFLQYSFCNIRRE